MSRIGQQPITVPAGITVGVDGDTVSVKGPKGELTHTVSHGITVSLDEGTLNVSRPNDSKDAKSFHGLHRSLISNMVIGCAEGYKKELEINGVGFRAVLQGMNLTLTVGYSHPVTHVVPDGVTCAVNGQTEVSVEGVDKQVVGNFAARIRATYPAEPYKGKGVKYKGEQIRRKVGKAVA